MSDRYVIHTRDHNTVTGEITVNNMMGVQVGGPHGTWINRDDVASIRTLGNRHAVDYCDADSKRGTGTGMCNAPLDHLGQCPRAGRHTA